MPACNISKEKKARAFLSFQARNNARILIAGSLSMFSNSMWQFLGEQIFSLCTHFQIGLAPFSDSFDLWGAEGRELNQEGCGILLLFAEFRHVKSGNEQFLTELNKWIFHDRDLKAVDVRHHKVGEAAEPAIYRIKDELEYPVEHMCGLEQAVNHMWQMMFKCSCT
ncbi:hypothetical protein NC651_022688 [Populus alba x Populus x berolinensis]|nr:hypothetical protein NC651_022688 [Populus alba x Populus x berolinensis]